MIFATEQKFIDQLEIDLKKEFDNKVDFVKNALEFEFLSMKFDFRAKGLAHVTMKDYIIAILEEYNALLKRRNTPAKPNLFEINENSELLDTLDKQKLRRGVAKLLYLACLVRPDVLCATIFFNDEST